LARNIGKKRDIKEHSFAHLTLILLLHYLVKCRSCILNIYNNEFMLGCACRLRKLFETRKSLKICYFFNINQEQVYRSLSRTPMNWKDASTVSGPLWVTRLLNVLMASGAASMCLRSCWRRTFWAHTVIKIMWGDTCDLFWETI